jgi:hypothetical protein
VFLVDFRLTNVIAITILTFAWEKKESEAKNGWQRPTGVTRYYLIFEKDKGDLQQMTKFIATASLLALGALGMACGEAANTATNKPANTAANTAPANTAPANTAPANTAPANTTPTNTASANAKPADNKMAANAKPADNKMAANANTKKP